MTGILQTVSCLDGYDPNALRVDKAVESIRACLAPIDETEKLPIREALGRVLAEEIVPPINVPAHDNSAMDGYAVRFSDLGEGETGLTEVGSAFAGRVFSGAIGPGQCVRVMTGAVMPAGTDTVVIQEVARKDGARIVVPPGQKKAQNVRYAGEDLKAGVPVLKPGKLLRAAELGLIASLGIAEVLVKRKLRVAFFSTGDELASIGAPLKEGEVYDSNRYTLYGMLERLGVEINDLGVVRDDPAAARAGVAARGAWRRCRHHDRRRVGRGSRLRKAAHGEARRGSLLEDCHAARAPDGLRQDRKCISFWPARQPGGGHGHLLPVRARGAAAPLGTQRRLCDSAA